MQILNNLFALPTVNKHRERPVYFPDEITPKKRCTDKNVYVSKLYSHKQNIYCKVNKFLLAFKVIN